MTDVIIAAAGSGTRFSPSENKLLTLTDNGKAVLRRSVEAFLHLADLGKIIVTARECDVEEYQRTLQGIDKVVIAIGGQTRSDSVRNALRLADGDKVMIHDGARPFVSRELVDRVHDAIPTTGGVLPALPETDTVKRVDGDKVVATLIRSELVRVQTPQAFNTAELKHAYDTVSLDGTTDDASVLEKAGFAVFTVEGEERNVKITFDGDKKYLECDVRTGIGYDVHRLVAGRPLMLGCVEVPHEKGLLGHSDADVIAHAICDAMLSAAANRDIGFHFPDTSAETEGMSGTEILKRTAQIVRNDGFEIVNVAVVAVAQRPKLAPHIPTMQVRIADALAIAESAVSVSATTTERLGFEGREEGISAQAVATLRKR